MADGDNNNTGVSKDAGQTEQNPIVNVDDGGKQRSRALFLGSIRRFADVLPSRHFTDLNQWPIFTVLELSMLAKIKRLCVFGSAANEAIFLTNDGDVYALGTNCSSCLGLGEMNLCWYYYRAYL